MRLSNLRLLKSSKKSSISKKNNKPKGEEKMATNGNQTLHNHLVAVKEGKRCFENAFQGVSRMILGSEIEKVTVKGKTTYTFKLFRTGKKHIIGMYDEINSFVSFVKDAAENGSSKEMAFVLVGEPGNGKTFFVDFLCSITAVRLTFLKSKLTI